MKIYILPVQKKFQPEMSPFKYPPHSEDYYVEQDFYNYLLTNRSLTIQNPAEADWHFLPIYWTRWHVAHDYARKGIEELQQEVNNSIIDENKTFSICQYDDGTVVNLGKTIVFLSARKIKEGIDIFPLCSPHRKPFLSLFIKPSKKYLASFVGRLSTHSIRQDMADKLKNRENIFIYDGLKRSSFFVKKTIESYISLCPRGYGGSSFRFYESMQLGVAPFFIGDIDTRPFKKWINWDEFSFFSKSTKDIISIINSSNKSDLLEMGNLAAKIYKEKLAFQKWCSYVIRELKELK